MTSNGHTIAKAIHCNCYPMIPMKHVFQKSIIMDIYACNLSFNYIKYLVKYFQKRYVSMFRADRLEVQKVTQYFDSGTGYTTFGYHDDCLSNLENTMNSWHSISPNFIDQ